MSREFRLCRVNKGVVTDRKKLPYCLVFVVKFIMKLVGSFNKVVAGCGVSDILEDIWGIL